MKNSLAIAILISMVFSAPMSSIAGQKRVEITTTAEDTEYLRQLAKDTWRCMEYFVSPRTGFPFDTDQKTDGTNTTNIGLYLASLSVAAEMGFIEREKAREKAEDAVDSLLKLQHWKGFFVNTVNVFGDIRASAGGNALSDFNKLPAGLIMVRQVFPELAPKCSTLLDRMDWSAFYDSPSKTLYGGFDVVKGEVLKPSWYGGGIFMHGICSLFLDEREACAEIS